MKRIALSTLCLVIAACTSTEKNFYQENCFVYETKITADMHKIRSVLIDYYKKENEEDTEYKLKIIKAACKLFGKNNKQLNNEVDKLSKDYDKKTNEKLKRLDNMKKTLKGLRLDYGQVLTLAKWLEKDLTEIENSNKVRFEPYKSQAIKILKTLDEQKRKDIVGYYHSDSDNLQFMNKFSMYFAINSLIDTRNKYDIYSEVIGLLEDLISDRILIDSFLKNYPPVGYTESDSLILNAFHIYYNIIRLTPVTMPNGENLFEAARKAALNEATNKDELSTLTSHIARYMREVSFLAFKFRHCVADQIDYKTTQDLNENGWVNKYSFDQFGLDRFVVTNLIDKNPKMKDFELEISKLASRLAYQTYHRVSIGRFLYNEWRTMYYEQIKELFVNGAKIADKLKEMIKDEKIPDDASDMVKYKHIGLMNDISNIKEIARTSVEKIILPANCNLDSQYKIKAAFNRNFSAIRKTYLKNR